MMLIIKMLTITGKNRIFLKPVYILSGGAGENYLKSGKNITFFILPQRLSLDLYLIFI